jgi:hypothetical protein
LLAQGRHGGPGRVRVGPSGEGHPAAEVVTRFGPQGVLLMSCGCCCVVHTPIARWSVGSVAAATSHFALLLQHVVAMVTQNVNNDVTIIMLVRSAASIVGQGAAVLYDITEASFH